MADDMTNTLARDLLIEMRDEKVGYLQALPHGHRDIPTTLDHIKALDRAMDIMDGTAQRYLDQLMAAFDEGRARRLEEAARLRKRPDL